MPGTATIFVHLSPTSEVLVLVREFIVSLAEQLAFPTEACAHIELAVDEACANSVRACGRAGCGGHVTVELAADDCALTITVIDNGEDFSEPFRRAIQIDHDLEQYRSSGYGLQFIRVLMDDVRYERREGCNRLSMKKGRCGRAQS